MGIDCEERELMQLHIDALSRAVMHLSSEHCVEELWCTIARLESQVKDLTLRNKVLRERPDLPADRIPAHNTVVQLQQENSNLKSLLGASHDSP